MNIAVIGCGFVGLITGITLALMKHKVIGVDIDETKVNKLNNKQPTFYEKGLPEALKQTIESGNLEFTTELDRTVKTCDYLFVTVPVPNKPNGKYNLDYVAEVVKSIDQLSPAKQKIIIIRSKVPVGTCEDLRAILDNKQHVIVYNPEFFRKGTALKDSLNPDRVVFGLPDFIPKPVGNDLKRILQNEIYRFDKDIPVILTDTNTSEVIRHTSKLIYN
jgi:UDPglucose 6-dehydrogenase